MKKYKLLKPFLDYKVGHVFEKNSDGDLKYVNTNNETIFIKPHEIELLKATGFLEEVVEDKKEMWKPKEGDRYYYVDDEIEVYETIFDEGVDIDRVNAGNFFQSRAEAQKYCDAIKSLLAKREL